MIKINIHQAKTHLSEYLTQLEKGEVIIICRKNIPVAELRAITPPAIESRPIGLAADQFDIPSSFFDPLPDEFIELFSTQEKPP